MKVSVVVVFIFELSEVGVFRKTCAAQVRQGSLVTTALEYRASNRGQVRSDTLLQTFTITIGK